MFTRIEENKVNGHLNAGSSTQDSTQYEQSREGKLPSSLTDADVKRLAE